VARRYARVKRFAVAAALFASSVVCAGCSFDSGLSSHAQSAPLPALEPASGNPVNKYIKHVVVIIQENRSFENFFAGYPGADAPMLGSADGKRVRLHEISFIGPDLPHDWRPAVLSWDHGKMDGFYRFSDSSVGGKDQAYAYVAPSLIAPYWAMARQYVLADHMFPTEFGPSFTAHLTLIAGTDDVTRQKAEVNFTDGAPDDCDSPSGTKSSTVDERRHVSYFTGPFPCFTQFRTMAETLDDAHVSWKFYATKLLNAGFWEPFEAIKYVREGPDWNKDIIVPQTRILTDPGHGKLASVTWVTPSGQDSDHPGWRSPLGPSWVAAVVNAVGESRYWKDSAIIILWDDWGGWYDNAPPPQLDFRGLGIRVPCLIVSPYAKHGYVSHTQYEYGSILKFIEQAFNLPPLGPTWDGYTDTRANSLVDSFDFTQKPRTFVPLHAPYPAWLFRTEAPSNDPVDTE
jgi:phospholipase C